jgi:hypothetical protein
MSLERQQERVHDLGHVLAHDLPGQFAHGAQMINLAIQGEIALAQFRIQHFHLRRKKGKPQAGLKECSQTGHELPVVLVVREAGQAAFQAENTVAPLVQWTDQQQLAFARTEFAFQGRNEIGSPVLFSQVVEVIAQNPGVFGLEISGLGHKLELPVAEDGRKGAARTHPALS